MTYTQSITNYLVYENPTSSAYNKRLYNMDNKEILELYEKEVRAKIRRDKRS